jgi:N utilization substance protein B
LSPNWPKHYSSSLKNSPEYAEYLAKTGRYHPSDKDIIKFIFKKVILKSSLAEQVFEDKFIFWPVDRDVLQALIAKTFKNFASEDAKQNPPGRNYRQLDGRPRICC